MKKQRRIPLFIDDRLPISSFIEHLEDDSYLLVFSNSEHEKASGGLSGFHKRERELKRLLKTRPERIAQKG